MKPRALYPALLIAGLFAACNSGNPASETTAETTALTDTTALKAGPTSDCEGIPLPGVCSDDCNSGACHDSLLKDHEVKDTSKYIITKPPFRYYDLGFNGKLDLTECGDNIVFVIFPNGSGAFSSNVEIEKPVKRTAYGFPASLFKGLRERFQSNFKHLDCHWADKSPHCTKGDILLDYTLKDGKHEFYNVSVLPKERSYQEAQELGLLDKAVPQLTE